MPLHCRTATYVDTPRGIFTDAGSWFRTREAWVTNYAPGVIARRPLGHLLADAELWLRSPQTLALWLLLPSIHYLPTPLAVIGCVGIFAIWKVLGPALVSRSALPLLRTMDSVLVQSCAYILVLSIAAMQSHFVIVGVGLSAFVALRWGLPDLVLQPLLRPVLSRCYRLPVSDHVLRSLIIRSALHYGVTLEDFAAIERSIIRGLARR